jgi:hypothetical protein
LELRYVYRSIEDAIGSRLDIEDSPHAWVTRKIRRDFREAHDLARHKEMFAMCMAAMSGNSDLDVQKMSDNVSDVLHDALYLKVPYIKPKAEKQDIKKQGSYDMYFDMLKEMQNKIDEEKRHNGDSVSGERPNA